MTKEDLIFELKKRCSFCLNNKTISKKHALENLLGILENEEFQHSLPSNLEEAARKYGHEEPILPEDYNDGDIPLYERWTAEAFKTGAEWMAGQEVKIGETKVYLEDDGDEPPYSQEWLDLETTEYQIPDGVFKNGDEVDVILRKK